MYTGENLISNENKKTLGKAMMKFVIGIMDKAESETTPPTEVELEILPHMIDRLLR